MRATLRWLRARADNVAVALLAAMFGAFLLQIVSRYVFNSPIGWTQEICVTTWLWAVFWGSAFTLDERDHVRFDLIYHMARPRLQRVFALVSAAALFAGFVASFPASLDYITFYKIKRSAMLGIRLDIVFSVYALFAVAVIVRSAIRFWRLARGRPLHEHEEVPTI
ncbi:MAG: TRAP transporter small permease [Rhizobiaceae bacterium]